jgi:hypothetical protein
MWPFYIWWALFATTGFWGRRLDDRPLRQTCRLRNPAIEAAVFMTVWIRETTGSYVALFC